MILSIVHRLAPLLVVSLCATSMAGCALFGIDPERLGAQGAPEASRPFATSVVREERVAREEPAPARPAAVRRPRGSAADGACVEGAGCVARLRRLVADPDRSWIGRPEQPASFADGTRLFAYRALRAKLGCRDLALARADVRNSTSLLQSAPGIAPGRAQKASALAADVAEELASEHDLRCKAMGQAATAAR
jgi:hypothetical protein